MGAHSLQALRLGAWFAVLWGATWALADEKTFSELVQDAEQQYLLPTDDEIAQLRRKVDIGLDRMRKQLEHSPLGESTKAAVRLDELAAQLASPQPDPAVLKPIAELLLERAALSSNVEYRNLGYQLRQYAEALSARNNPRAREDFATALAVLQHSWEQYQAAPSAAAQAVLADRYARLSHTPSIYQPLGAVRRRISWPNQVVVIAQPLLQSELAGKPIQSPFDINERDKKTRIRGRGDFLADVKLTMIPNDAVGQMRVDVKGTGKMGLTASQGPAVVLARGTTDIDTGLDLHFTPDGLVSRDMRVDVRNDITPYSADLNICVRWLRKLGSRIILKVANKQKGKLDQSSQDRTRQMVESKLTEYTTSLSQQTRYALSRWLPMTALAPNPPLHTRSTATHLFWSVEIASPWQLAAPEPAPLPEKMPSILTLLHQSALNNTGYLLHGRWLDEPEFEELAWETIALVPVDDPAVPRGRIPARIQLSDDVPVPVFLDDGRVGVHVRIAAFELDGKRYEGGPWAVEAEYQPKIGPRGVEVIRQGNVRVTPDTGEVDKLLASVITRFLVAKATTQEITLIGDLGRGMQLRVVDLHVDNGWLRVGWEQDTASPAGN